MDDEESCVQSISKDDCIKDHFGISPTSKPEFIVSEYWAIYPYRTWFICSMIMIVHTWLIGTYHGIAEDSIVLYFFIFVYVALRRSVETLYFSASEYQMIIYVAWVFYGYATRNIHVYIPQTLIIVTNVITIVIITVAHMPVVFRKEDNGAMIVLFSIVALVVPHYNANIIHSNVYVSVTRVLIFVLLYYAMARMNVIEVNRHGFYRWYYLRTIDDVHNNIDVQKARRKRILFPMRFPQWFVTISTSWVLICDPLTWPFAAVQIVAIYYMKLGAMSILHRREYQHNPAMWIFYTIGKKSVDVSAFDMTDAISSHMLIETMVLNDPTTSITLSDIDKTLSDKNFRTAVVNALFDKKIISVKTEETVTNKTIQEDRAATQYIEKTISRLESLRQFYKK